MYFLQQGYWKFTTKSLQVFTIHFLRQVFERSWEGHHKLSVFISLSCSNKLLKVHSIATANWQYLFLTGHSKLFKVHENFEVSRTPSQFSRMLFNTQIIPYYKNTFSVRSAINQYQYIPYKYQPKKLKGNQNSRSDCSPRPWTFRLKYFIQLQGTWGNLKYNMKPILTFTQVVFTRVSPKDSFNWVKFG